jgi:hypothetical protein
MDGDACVETVGMDGDACVETVGIYRLELGVVNVHVNSTSPRSSLNAAQPAVLITRQNDWSCAPTLDLSQPNTKKAL